MIRLAAASALAAGLLCAVPATAADHRIAFGDLDLASPEGAARFDRRVGRAARSACLTGAVLADAQCVVRFRAEAFDQLPPVRRDDYARARAGRDQARRAADPG